MSYHSDELLQEIVWGRNVEIFYNKIKKSIKITYFDVMGQRSAITLYYIKSTKDFWEMTINPNMSDHNTLWRVVFDPAKPTSFTGFPGNSISNGFSYKFKISDIYTAKEW
jgi:hypothetical protein